MSWNRSNMKFKRPRQAPPPAPVVVQEPFLTGGQAARVLVAHNDVNRGAAIASLLRDNEFIVTQAADACELGEHVGALADGTGETPAFDFIIAHSAMPGMSGLQVLRELRSAGCVMPVILITPPGDDETRERALFLGAAAVFMEPLDLQHLLIVLLHLTRTSLEAGDLSARM